MVVAERIVPSELTGDEIDRRNGEYVSALDYDRLAIENDRLRRTLNTALGRLTWAANANPGVRDERGKELVLSWVEEGREALRRGE